MAKSSTLALVSIVALLAGARAAAQTKAVGAGAPPAANSPVPVAKEYVIGPEDVLGVVFWRDKDLSGDVAVRPDGRITLPLLGDLQAAGLRPEALRDQIQKTAQKYLTEPNVTVIVRQIKSRVVFVTGEVARPGPYAVGTPLTVLQLLALAGGVLEYADEDKISILRQKPDGTTTTYRFNYKDVARGRKLEQNIFVEPGDTIVIP